MAIGARLKEERLRLGFSQTEFAALGGASKRSQIVWESEEEGAAAPNATFLAAVAAAGVDVAYVVTGVRTLKVGDSLPPRELALLNNYRNADAEGKKSLERQSLLEAERSARVEVHPGGRERVFKRA